MYGQKRLPLQQKCPFTRQAWKPGLSFLFSFHFLDIFKNLQFALDHNFITFIIIMGLEII